MLQPQNHAQGGRSCSAYDSGVLELTIPVWSVLSCWCSLRAASAHDQRYASTCVEAGADIVSNGAPASTGAPTSRTTIQRSQTSTLLGSAEDSTSC
eukprot:5411297-Amphidinium_carterae.1